MYLSTNGQRAETRLRTACLCVYACVFHPACISKNILCVILAGLAVSDSLRGLEVTHSVCLAAWYAMVDADTTPYSMQLAACSPPSMRPSPSAMAHGRAKAQTPAAQYDQCDMREPACHGRRVSVAACGCVRCARRGAALRSHERRRRSGCARRSEYSRALDLWRARACRRGGERWQGLARYLREAAC